MNNYEVVIVRTIEYSIDVVADSEDDAVIQALELFDMDDVDDYIYDSSYHVTTVSPLTEE